MNKLGRALLTIAVASSLVVTPVFAEPSVSDLEASKSAAESQVSSLQSELTELLDKMGQLEEEMIQKGEAIATAEADLQASEQKEAEQYEAMKLRIKFLYESGDTSAVESLITASNFTDLVNKAEYVNNVHKYDREQLQAYVDTKNEIAELKETLETEQQNLESMQSEYEAQEQSLNATIESKQSEIADFDAQIQAAAEAAAAEAAARAAAEAEAAAAAEAQANQSTSSSSGNSSEAVSSSSDSGSSYSSGTTSTVSSTQSTTSSGSEGNTSTAQAIVDAAYSQLGVPYVWGGTTPYSGLDCSGLVQYCHSVAGISLPRVSQAQGGCGVAVSDPQPGDMVCYGSHIAIYIGGGQMIHAPKPGDVVKIANVYGSPWYRRCW